MAYQGILINTANTIFQDRRVVFQKNELEGGFQAEHQALGTLRRSSLTTLVKAVIDEWFSLKDEVEFNDKTPTRLEEWFKGCEAIADVEKVPE